MKQLYFLCMAALLAGALFSVPAGATVITINGSSFPIGDNNEIIGGLIWTSSPGNFAQKTVAGYTGVGITGGPTGDEIDIGEFLTATTTGLPFWVPSFTLGVLFDGPEFNDVQEVAQVTITSLSLGTLTYTLTNTYDASIPPDTAVWAGPITPGASVLNLSPSTGSGGAVWKITNPFGAINDIIRMQFTALPGVSADICGNGSQVCTNQSDFTLVQLEYETVPEPGTYALLGAGLIALGLLARRRRG